MPHSEKVQVNHNNGTIKTLLDTIMGRHYRKQVKVRRLPHLSHRTAEPTVWGFYKNIRTLSMGSCRKEIKMAEKYRFPVYIPSEQNAEIDAYVDNGYAKSKNDFINKAIEFYMGYLRNEKNIDYIAPILSSVLKSQMVDIERNLSEILFKLAVEVAKQNHIAVSRGELSEETLLWLNDMCCRDVASNNGRVQFENAYRFQHSEDGDY